MGRPGLPRMSEFNASHILFEFSRNVQLSGFELSSFTVSRCVITRTTRLTHLSQMDLPNLISRTSPFKILGVLGCIFLFFFTNFNGANSESPGQSPHFRSALFTYALQKGC